MKERSILALHRGQPTEDGNRVPLTRLVPGLGQRGTDAFRDMDPFLLVDHFGPMVLPPGTDAGFPPHPHKGFQTLTYLLQGAFRHRDSTGGAGRLDPGGAQLMTAGRGIVHEEMPVPEHLETGGAIEGVQIWINLPRARKEDPPGYVDLQPAAMPWVPVPGGRIRVLAGTAAGVTGPAQTPVPLLCAHLELEAGAAFALPLPPAWMAAVIPLAGTVRIGEAEAGPDTVARLGDGDGAVLGAVTAASVMVLAGEPLREPIAHYGPFVMNTAEEIQRAFEDYQAGRFGTIG